MKSKQGATQASAGMGRVAIASCVGTAIEFYDFYIYGTAAALVFPKVFFPALGATSGKVASFATFAVAFIARPAGAVSFGHYGDRIVVLLRFAQGFAVGGEWAGATLLTAEYAPSGRRGRYAMFPQLGPAVTSRWPPPRSWPPTSPSETPTNLFPVWLADPVSISIVLVAAGLYVRMEIEETPVFRAAEHQQSTHIPLREALVQAPREILLAAGSLTMVFALFYTGNYLPH